MRGMPSATIRSHPNGPRAKCRARAKSRGLYGRAVGEVNAAIAVQQRADRSCAAPFTRETALAEPLSNAGERRSADRGVVYTS